MHMIQNNIILKLDDNRTPNSIYFQLSPLQTHLVMRMLGLDFDTATGQIEYFDDRAIEHILAYDTFLHGLEKKRSTRDIHNPDANERSEKEKKRKK